MLENRAPFANQFSKNSHIVCAEFIKQINFISKHRNTRTKWFNINISCVILAIVSYIMINDLLIHADILVSLKIKTKKFSMKENT